MTSFRVGTATDTGRVRNNNQDSSLVGADLFAVADGMGGHQGGEVASALAVQILQAEATGASVDVVPSRRAAGQPGDLREGGRRRGAARHGHDPVRAPADRHAGRPARGLGQRRRLARLSVPRRDAHPAQRGPQPRGGPRPRRSAEQGHGGRPSAAPHRHPRARHRSRRGRRHRHGHPVPRRPLLLCSDGLFNEVDDNRIAGVLRRLADPDEACAELVRLANDHGGRDNITIVLVDVVDDGGRAESASAALVDDSTQPVPIPPQPSTGRYGADDAFADQHSLLPDADDEKLPAADEQARRVLRRHAACSGEALDLAGRPVRPDPLLGPRSCRRRRRVVCPPDLFRRLPRRSRSRS